jgi:hypothetical protein
MPDLVLALIVPDAAGTVKGGASQQPPAAPSALLAALDDEG